MHQIQLTGLLPHQRYYYQFQSGTFASPTYQFMTAASPASEEAWRFVAIADTQRNDTDPQRHREVIEEGIVDFVQTNLGPDLCAELAFITNAGDLVDDGGSTSDWRDDFFAQAELLFPEVPLYPVLGNHRANNALYFEYLKLPENGVPSHLEQWYFKDHQNVRLISLDTNAPFNGTEQLNWIDRVLSTAAINANIDFVFVQLHHPVKTEFSSPREHAFGDMLVEKLETFTEQTGKPTMHLAGHYHGYSRGQSRDHKHVWLNVASAMGPAAYWQEFRNFDYPEIQISVPEYGFALIDVEAGPDPSFRVRRYSRGNRSIARDNDLIDDFTVRRYNTGPGKPTANHPNASSGLIPGYDVELVGSTFSDVNGEFLLESHWQVSAVPGDYSSPLIDDWRHKENWFRPANGDDWYSVNTVQAPNIENVFLNESLPGCSQLYWRVRYRNSALEWSEWSDEASFQVGNSDFGMWAPTPSDGQVGIGLTPTLAWSMCLPPDSYQVYFGTQQALGAGDHMGNMTIAHLSLGRLQPDTSYYWRVDAVTGGMIETGNTWSFTTGPEYPSQYTTEWRFNDNPPIQGLPFFATHGNAELSPQGMSYGSDWAIWNSGTAVPHIQGVAAKVLRMSHVFGPGRGLRLSFEAPALSNILIEEFTFIWDIYLPPGHVGQVPLWQNDFGNFSAAEAYMDGPTGGFFVRGLTGSGLFDIGRWNRVAHRINNAKGTSAMFVNGVKVLSDSELPAPGWFLSAASDGSGWMFTDQVGNHPSLEIYCANVAVVGGLVSDEDIFALGSPRAAGIFVDNPSSYCASTNNSTGFPAVIQSSGPPSQATNAFALQVNHSVPGSLGFFFFGKTPGQFPMGAGFACIAPRHLTRDRRLGPVTSNALGNVSYPIDMMTLPEFSGPAIHRAGSPTYFQYWYRDSAAGGQGSNLSNGLRVQFYR